VVTFFTVCAVVGSVVLVLQFVMMLIGLDSDQADIGDVGDDIQIGDEYVDAHAAVGHSSGWFFGVLSFKSLVAAIAFFGLGGRAALAAEFSSYVAFFAATASGVAAMILVAWLMRTLYRLSSEGNVRIERCVGQVGTVYLSIPGARAGTGKVTMSVQQRTMEYQAVTDQGEIPTGARVTVVGISGPGTLEVELESS